MAPPLRPKKGSKAGSGRVRKALRRLFNVRVDVAVLTTFFVLGWQAGRLPLWGFFGGSGPEAGQRVSCPEGKSPRNSRILGQGREAAFDMASHQAKLVSQIRLNAPAHLAERCVEMVLGQQWSPHQKPFERAFAQGYQDWVMYHSFFSRMDYGEGFYVDVGANDPVNGSNTFFFDACLGWQGICMEPNPMYAESFKANRTCIHVKNCVGPEEAVLRLSAEMGTKGSVSGGGKGIEVLCRPLQDVLAEHKVGMTHKGQRRIDFASLDVEGFEYRSFRCFPFDLFDIPVWLIETKHQRGYSIDRMMDRAGYWKSPQLIVHWQLNFRPRNIGVHMDNLFVRWTRPKWMYFLNASAAGAQDHSNALAAGKGPPRVPALVLGPDFLPGGVLEGESFVAPCSSEVPADCPHQVPAVEAVQEYKGGNFVMGECKEYDGVKHRLSKPRSD